MNLAEEPIMTNRGVEVIDSINSKGRAGRGPALSMML
jgi:hypothetical protein